MTDSVHVSQGVIAVDDTLEGSQVQLRPSQDKFRGFAERIGVSNNFCLNVSDAFTRPNPLRLSASHAFLVAFSCSLRKDTVHKEG